MSEQLPVQTAVTDEPVLPSAVEPGLDEIDHVIPKMNVGVPPAQPEPGVESVLVPDDALLGIYNEILDNCRKDREELSQFVTDFANMVINDQDASSSSKEALVNLVKAKGDVNDKMAKVADLMTRVKLKSADTFPRYLAAQQNNTINIGTGGGSKRELLEAIEKQKKGKK